MNVSADFIQTYADSCRWVQTLARVPAQFWLVPMQPGTWSVAECLAHLIAWDRYVLLERLAPIRTGKDLAASPDAHTVNAEAAAYARSGIEPMALINEFIHTRTQLIDAVRTLMSNPGQTTFTIQEYTISLAEYLAGLVEHQQEHQHELDAFVKQWKH